MQSRFKSALYTKYRRANRGRSGARHVSSALRSPWPVAYSANTSLRSRCTSDRSSRMPSFPFANLGSRDQTRQSVSAFRVLGRSPSDV